MILAAAATHAQEPTDTAAIRRITVETARYDGYQYYDTGQLYIMAHYMLDRASDPNYRVTFRIINKTPHPTAVKVPKFEARAEILTSQGFKDVKLYTFSEYMGKVRRAEVLKALWLYDLNSAEQRASTVTMAESAAISNAYLDTCLLQEGQMVDGFVYVDHSDFHQRLKVSAYVGDRYYDFEWRIGNDKCAPVK